MSSVPFVFCLFVGLIAAKTIQYPPVSISISAQTSPFLLPRGPCEATCKLGDIVIKDEYNGPDDGQCVSCTAQMGYCSCLGGQAPDSGECPNDKAGWNEYQKEISNAAMLKAQEAAEAAGETSFSYVPPYAPFAIAAEICPCKLDERVIDGSFFGVHREQCVRCHECSCEAGKLPDKGSCPANDTEWSAYVKRLTEQAVAEAKAKAIADLKKQYGDDIIVNDA